MFFFKEKNEVLDGLKEKANLVTKLFNSIKGIKCNPVQGGSLTSFNFFVHFIYFIIISAMYAFPQITIPKRAIKHAIDNKMEPDAFYCFVTNFFFKLKLNTYSIDDLKLTQVL